jgi:hypothetical protein
MGLLEDMVEHRAAVIGVLSQNFKVKRPTIVPDKVIELSRSRVIEQATFHSVHARGHGIGSFSCHPYRDRTLVHTVQGNGKGGEEFLDQSIELVVPLSFGEHHHGDVSFTLFRHAKAIAQLKSLRGFPADIVLHLTGEDLAHLCEKEVTFF